MTNKKLPATPSLDLETDDKEIKRSLVMQIIGRVQMANSFSKFSTAVGTLQMKQIKEDKAYSLIKGQKGIDRHGNEITDVGTWAGFCKACGTSQQKVDEDISNLEAFGQETLEVMQHAGVGIRDLRVLRKLPEEELLKLEDQVVNTKDTAAVVEVIEDLVAAKQEKERMNSDLQAALIREQTAKETLDAKNEMLREQLREKEIQTWPEFTREIRMESSALGDKALLCIDDLERLMAQLEEPELNPDDPERTAHYSAAVMAFWTNLRAVQARINRLVGIGADSFTDTIDETPEGLAPTLMPDKEIVSLVSARELMVGEHKAEKMSREAQRALQTKKRGRRKSTKNK